MKITIRRLDPKTGKFPIHREISYLEFLQEEGWREEDYSGDGDWWMVRHTDTFFEHTKIKQPMMIINLTPHNLDMADTGKAYPRTEVAPGRFLIVRAAESIEKVGSIDGHVISKSAFKEPYFCTVDSEGRDERPYEGVLPDGDFFVVSLISLQAIVKYGGAVLTTPGGNKEALGEKECLAPGRSVRDDKGRIIGIEGFTTL